MMPLSGFHAVMNETERHCDWCGSAFTPVHWIRGHRFCTEKCSKNFHNRNRHPETKIRCKSCGHEFLTTRPKRQIYCSKKCVPRRKAESGFGRKAESGFSGLATGTVGTVSELTICCDLTRRGYEVFKAISPHCSCDLVILKNGNLLRVEVRTGSIWETGKRKSTKPKNGDEGRYDVFAVCYPDGVIYDPAIP